MRETPACFGKNFCEKVNFLRQAGVFLVEEKAKRTLKERERLFKNILIKT